jgi:glucosamine 6-phosphate synthetase-like amidotransferase/phosphosugar isomerase protein
VCVSLYLGLDDEGTVSSDSDLFLHHTEVVETTDEQTSTVGSQGEVHIITHEPEVEQRKRKRVEREKRKIKRRVRKRE